MGGGPAGLTAALELTGKTAHNVVLIEQETQVGGISRTVNYKGNRMDIGGHRFFSRSDTVMEWWQNILPVVSLDLAEKRDDVMLVRNRLSRISYLRQFFDYPIALKWETLKNLGFVRVLSMGAAYSHAALFPRKPEKSLEDFFINRFGKTLYETFFRDYTEKVWGVPCNQIASAWGAQRVKNLSIIRVLRHAIMSLFTKSTDIKQKSTDTSLIEQFLYPKFGPGQLWENVAGKIMAHGGTVLLHHRVTGMEMENGKVTSVHVEDTATGERKSFPCSAAISSLPLRELIPMLDAVPEEVHAVCKGLVYRDFITVGLLVNKLRILNRQKDAASGSRIQDNWIYIQEPDVRLGRIQIFNNWSPYLVKDADKVWLGLEYFATEGDSLWALGDGEVIDMAVRELVLLGFIRAEDAVDATVLRVKKAYPAYFGTYPQIGKVQEYLDSIPNLYPVGRNGMHRYNNMDHSMLSSILAVSCILDPSLNKAEIWNINESGEYHESK